MEKIEIIKDRIKTAINQSNLTQAEIANLLGIKQTALSRYANGDTLPKISVFANLCKILNADPNYILDIKKK